MQYPLKPFGASVALSDSLHVMFCTLTTNFRTYVNKKNAVFWAVGLCGFIIHRRFGVLAAVSYFSSLPNFVYSEDRDDIFYSETSVYNKLKQRHILEGGSLHNHSRDDLKCYNIRTSLQSWVNVAGNVDFETNSGDSLKSQILRV
jgi:hypothetical protein